MIDKNGIWNSKHLKRATQLTAQVNYDEFVSYVEKHIDINKIKLKEYKYLW